MLASPRLRLMLKLQAPCGPHLLRSVFSRAPLDRLEHALALRLASRVAAIHVSVRCRRLQTARQGAGDCMTVVSTLRRARAAD